MSCITAILQKKGDAEFFPAEREAATLEVGVEGGGIHKGYEYLVTFNDMGFRCGYVALPPGHKYHDSDVESDDDGLCVHGGITFHGQHSLVEAILGVQCTDVWIGFDASHYGDLVDVDSTLKYFPNLRGTRKDYVIEMAKCFEQRGEDLMAVRDLKYMEEQCKRLIDQIIEKEAA